MLGIFEEVKRDEFLLFSATDQHEKSSSQCHVKKAQMLLKVLS